VEPGVCGWRWCRPGSISVDGGDTRVRCDEAGTDGPERVLVAPEHDAAIEASKLAALFDLVSKSQGSRSEVDVRS